MIAICLPDHAVEKTLIAERERMMASRDLLCAGEAAVVRSAGTSAGLLFRAMSLAVQVCRPLVVDVPLGILVANLLDG